MLAVVVDGGDKVVFSEGFGGMRVREILEWVGVWFLVLECMIESVMLKI